MSLVDLKIAEATIDLARSREMMYRDVHLPISMRFEHLLKMRDMLDQFLDMDVGKCGRFIGWMQASVCASGIATMEEFREMNRRIING